MRLNVINFSKLDQAPYNFLVDQHNHCCSLPIISEIQSNLLLGSEAGLKPACDGKHLSVLLERAAGAGAALV